MLLSALAYVKTTRGLIGLLQYNLLSMQDNFLGERDTFTL
jgi:hypothetical protein